MATKTLVYITGPGHSGSTLLSLLLNNSPLVQSMGEVHRVGRCAREDFQLCTCGERVSECPFWVAVEKHLVARLHRPSTDRPLQTLEFMLRPAAVNPPATLLQKLMLVLGTRRSYQAIAPFICPEHFQAVNNSLLLYESVRALSGAPLVIDSTKNTRRMKALYLAEPELFRAIIMIRDGRAVTASAIRRSGVDMATAAREWISQHAQLWLALASVPRDRLLQVRYETLCQDLLCQLRRVSAFLAIPFSPDLAALRKEASHDISGNPMRFRRAEATVRFDERWREELNPSQLHDFDRIAGWLNRHLGYLY